MNFKDPLPQGLGPAARAGSDPSTGTDPHPGGTYLAVPVDDRGRSRRPAAITYLGIPDTARRAES